MEKNITPQNQYTVKKSASGNNCHQQKTAQRLAEQHNVSERTIRRDARVARAVDKIGETSLVAKQEKAL